MPIKALAKPIWVICARPPRLVPPGCRLRGRPGGLRTAARRVGWTQKRKTKDGVGRFRACYRDIRGQVQSARTFAKEREADKAVDVTRSVAYFHNANISSHAGDAVVGGHRRRHGGHRLATAAAHAAASASRG